MHQVKPYPLWIGHAGDGRNFRQVFDNGIEAIVQLAVEEAPLQPPHELIYYRIPLIDGTGNAPILLDLAIHSVATLHKNGVPTLVCCGGGMSRSPAIVAGALSAVEQKPLDDCLKIVTESYPADVLPGLWEKIRHILEEDQGE
jgi:protein-tyrosine phosphatase